MMNKKTWNIVISLLLIICILIGIITPSIVNADVTGDSESSHTVRDGDGDIVLTVIMREGIITIVGKANAASTSIRWETIGLTLTKEKITTTTTAKGYSGPGPVKDADGQGIASLYFYNAFKKSDVKNGDTVTTTITFSADQVERAFKDNFDTIEKGMSVYLHGIFRTYDYENGVKTTRSGKGNLKNWKDIMDAEWWGTDTLGDFKKYYNMQIEFMPALPTNTLYFETESGDKTLKPNVALESKKIGERVAWSNQPVQITYNKLTYKLIGYYTTKKNDNTQTWQEDYFLRDGWDLNDIKSSNAEVFSGGTDVYLIYSTTPIQIPTPTPKITPIPIPIPTAGGGTPTPSPTPIVIPQTETISVSMNTPVAIGNIHADIRRSEKFIVNAGVPTTESLYTQVQASEYLMGYTLKKQVGKETYPVTITKDYILEWMGEDADGEIEMTETITVKQVVNIQRAYGYWEIINFDLYKIGNTVINNYALPNGSTTMVPNYSAGYNPPNATTIHSASKDSHIIIPDEIEDGIELPTETIVGCTNKPTIAKEDFTSTVDGMIPNLKVKNDTMILDGTIIMSASPTEKEGPGINATYLSGLRTDGTETCNENVLYKSGQVIDATKKNGTYHSAGVITYSRVNSVNSKYSSNIQSSIMNLSSVVIHTPVLCESIVTADNDQYVQLIKPTSAMQLVLDPNSKLNDFTLYISNVGAHSYKQGYYSRDFSRSLRDANVSYIATMNGVLRNEVKFPFDVYMKQSSEDSFVEKNTWIVIGRNTASFYLPMWIVEGTYTVACRTVAVNAGNAKLDEITEVYANTELFNYVATDTFEVEVSGRIYGLSIYDLTDYPIWEEVFRVKNSLGLKINDQNTYLDGTDKTTYSKGYSYNYTVGTNDQYGKDTERNVKYTFPLVNNSHPLFKNIGVLKTGYAVRFKLNTIGTMYSSGSYVKLKPTFYYVDANGKNRIAVDLYYQEEIDGKNRSMVKMGNSLDQINMKSMEVGSPYTGIPVKEMKDTASILKMKHSTFISRVESIFTFKDIRISAALHTFVNKVYTNSVVNSSQYPKIQSAGITTDNLMKQMQSWYGCYYLPGSLHAASQGYNVYDYASKYGITYKENFWKTNGYIIVNFDIVTVDSNGKERLSYINSSNYLNNGNNSMWVTEGAPLTKNDNKGVKFQFKAGDFIIYYTDRSVQDDYSSGGIY